MIASRPLAYYVAVAALLVVGFVLLLPVAAVYFWAFAADGVIAQESLFQLSRQVPLLMRSLAVGGGAATIALILGVCVGAAAMRATPFVRKVMGLACATSLLTPPYVFAIAWIDLWGPSGWFHYWAPMETMRPGDTVYSVPGAAIALAAAYYPIVAIATYVALRRVDHRWQEAASVSGRSSSYFTNISLPVIIRPIAAGFVVVFLLAIYDFPVHSLLQVNTYLVEIHAASEYHDYRAAALLSLPLVILASALLAGGNALIRPRHNYANSGIAREYSIPHSPRRIAWLCTGWAIILIASILPLITITIRAMPPSTFARLIETAWQELCTSVLLAATAATFIVLLGTMSATVLQHSRARAAANVISAVPFLISGPLLGLGLIAVYNHAGPLGLVYDSAAILLLAWVARYAFIAQWGIGAGVRGQAPSGCEAARVAGVSWVRMQLGVVIAQALPYIAMVWGAAFVLTFREIDTAVLVAPPGMTLASVRLFTLMHYGPDGYVMAMALTMSTVMIGVGVVIYGLFARWKRIPHART